MIRILSLGAGVQSSSILMMSIHGELPRLDHCIFADVGWEPPEVYEWMEMLRGYADKAGIPIHTVSEGNLRDHVMDSVKTGKRASSPPFFTEGEDGRASIINRSCTSNFKIAPIARKVKELMGHKPGSRLPKECRVEQWIGISGDEMQRMKSSVDPWFRFWHPLIEQPYPEDGRPAMLRDWSMTRQDCLNWMSAHGYPTPPRSACIGCPFHSNAEWRRIRQDPALWADAVEFDKAIRDHMPLRGMRKPIYLHRSLLPLDQAPIDGLPGQQGIDWGMDQECAGICGV